MKKMNALIILALALIFALPFAAKAEAAGAITSVKFLYADGESFKAADGYGEHEIELELLFTLGQKAKNFEAVFETSFLINPAAEVAAAELQNGDGSRAAGLSPKALSAPYAFANGFEIVFPPGLELEAGDYIIPITIKCDLEAPAGEVMTAFKVNIRKLSCEQAEKAAELNVGFSNHYNKDTDTKSSTHRVSMQFVMINGTTGEAGRPPLMPDGITMKFYFQAKEDLDVDKFRFEQKRFMFLNNEDNLDGYKPEGLSQEEYDNWRWWEANVSKLTTPKTRTDGGKTKTANYVLTVKIKEGFGKAIESGKYLLLGIGMFYFGDQNSETDFLDSLESWENSYSYIDADDIISEDKANILNAYGTAHGEWPFIDSEAGGNNNDGSGGTNSFEPAGDSGIAYLVDAISDPADTAKNTVPMNPLLISIDLSSYLGAYGRLSEPYLHQLEVDITEEGGGDFYTWFMPGALPTAGTSTESLIKIMDSSGADITSGYTDMDMSSFAIRSGETTPPLGDSDGDGTDDLDISALPGIGDSFYERFDFMIYPVWTEHDVENNAERNFKVTISAVLINSQIIRVDEKSVTVYSQEDVSILTKKDTVRVEVFKTVQ